MEIKPKLKLSRKTFQKVINFIVNITPFMWALAVGISLIEAFFYPGFVIKHISFNPAIIYGGFLLSGLVNLFGAKPTNIVLPSLMNKLSYLAIFLFGLAFFAFYLLDTVKYANFTFSTFHLHTLQLTVPLALSVYMYLVSLKWNTLKFLGTLKPIYKLKFLLIAILLWICVPNVIDLVKFNAINLSFIFKNPTASYDTKMEYLLGKQFYNYVLFIKANTPENAKILLPPFRYFLYPRTTLNGNEYNSGYDLGKERVGYVLVAWGETESTSGGYTHGWPKFDVEADRIIYVDEKGEINTKPGDYIYKNVVGQQLWGLIKVKK
jgi:hypothetical protein